MAEIFKNGREDTQQGNPNDILYVNINCVKFDVIAKVYSVQLSLLPSLSVIEAYKAASRR